MSQRLIWNEDLIKKYNQSQNNSSLSIATKSSSNLNKSQSLLSKSFLDKKNNKLSHSFKEYSKLDDSSSSRKIWKKQGASNLFFYESQLFNSKGFKDKPFYNKELVIDLVESINKPKKEIGSCTKMLDTIKIQRSNSNMDAHKLSETLINSFYIQNNSINCNGNNSYTHLNKNCIFSPIFARSKSISDNKKNV